VPFHRIIGSVTPTLLSGMYGCCMRCWYGAMGAAPGAARFREF